MISTAASKAAGVGLSSAATLGIAAGAFAAEQLLKHLVGQGRKAADKWVQGGGGQNAFLKNVLEPASKLAQSDPEKAKAYVDQAWRSYLTAANEYASKGRNQEKVIHQNLTTPAFMQTVQGLLGKDPLGTEYTNQFFGGAKNVLTKAGSSIVGGLGKILSTILQPTSVQGTPPYVPGNVPRVGQGGVQPTPGVSPENGRTGAGTSTSTGNPLLQLGVELGGQIGMSALGGLLGKVRPTENEQSVINNALAAQKAGMSAGQQMLGMGTQALQPALNYEQSILSGDRSKITSALAPDIQRIGQGYKAASEASAALNPRGGPSVAFNSELPYQQQRDVSTLMQKARPEAASSLLGAGSNLFNNGVNAIYGSTQAGQGVLQQQADARRIEAQRGKDIGAGMFDTFQKYGMPALQKQWPNIFGGAA